MKRFNLKIAQIDKAVFDGEVVSVTLPAETGEMTILANHEPVVAKLKEGKIKVKTKDKEEEFFVKDALFEFSDNNANVLMFV